MLWSRCLYGLPFWVFFYQSDCTQVRHTHQHWVGGCKGVYVTTPTCECLLVKHRYPKLLVKAFAYVVCVLWTRHCLCLFSFCAVVMWSTCAEYTWHETAKVVRATDAMQSCWPWTKAAFDNYKAAAAAAMVEPEPIMTVSHIISRQLNEQCICAYKLWEGCECLPITIWQQTTELKHDSAGAPKGGPPWQANFTAETSHLFIQNLNRKTHLP